MKYIDQLILAFREKSPAEKQRLIRTMCQVVTIGCATVLLCLFYPFIPSAIRLIAVPITLLFSHFIGEAIVANIIFDQFNITEKQSESVSVKSLNSIFTDITRNLKLAPSIAYLGILICFSLFLCGFLSFFYK